MRGVVLTDTNNLQKLVDDLRINELAVLKIVTQWGCSGGWTSANIGVASRVACLVVRTHTGDGKYIDANTAINELRPFYNVRPDMIAEIGNEPNRDNASNDEIYGYRWHCIEIAQRVAYEMPHMRLIMPAMIVNNDMHRWYSILGDLVYWYDYIGLHAYEWYNFNPPGTNQLNTVLHAANNICLTHAYKPSMITELGINDPATPETTKVQRYRDTINTLPGDIAATMCYHTCDKPLDADQAAYKISNSSLHLLK